MPQDTTTTVKDAACGRCPEVPKGWPTIPTPAASAGPVRLLLGARDASHALSICEKTLWSLTEPRGPIPCVRIGKRVLYSLDALREWIRS